MRSIKTKEKKYIAFRIKEDAKYTHDEIKKLFGYESSFILKGQPRQCGYSNNGNMVALINEIINKSVYDLISVSEDAKSVTYHFIGYED